MAGVGWRGGEKMQTSVIEEQFKKKKRIWILGDAIVQLLDYLTLRDLTFRISI